MKGFWKAFITALNTAAEVETPAPAAAPAPQAGNVTNVQPQPTQQPSQPVLIPGVAQMIGEAMSMPEGSAIKAFTPVYLNKLFALQDDIKVVARRGREVKYFLNPSLDLLGKLNTRGQGMWDILVELDDVDKASALVFVVSESAYENAYLNAYPTLVVDLGKGEYALVYRLNQVIDRAITPKEFRARGILEEVMGRKLKADVAPHRTLPLAGFFLNDRKGNGSNKTDAVRLVRYGQAYELEELIRAFGATKEINAAFTANPMPDADVAVNEETGEVPCELAQTVMDTEFGEIIAFASLTMYKAEIVCARIAYKLMEADIDEETRRSLAPELYARLVNLDETWVEEAALTEDNVVAIFAHPENYARNLINQK